MVGLFCFPCVLFFFHFLLKMKDFPLSLSFSVIGVTITQRLRDSVVSNGMRKD